MPATGSVGVIDAQESDSVLPDGAPETSGLAVANQGGGCCKTTASAAHEQPQDAYIAPLPEDAADRTELPLAGESSGSSCCKNSAVPAEEGVGGSAAPYAAQDYTAPNTAAGAALTAGSAAPAVSSAVAEHPAGYAEPQHVVSSAYVSDPAQAYNHPAGHANSSNGLAITSLILGAVGLLSVLFLPGINLVIAIAGIVTGFIAGSKKQSKKLWVTGVSLGALAVILAILFVVAMAFILQNNPGWLHDILNNANLTPQEQQQIENMLESIES